MGPRHLLRPLAVVALACATAQGCSLVVPFDDYLKPPADAGQQDAEIIEWLDGSSDADSDAGNCVEDVCITELGPGELALPMQGAAALQLSGSELYLLRDDDVDAASQTSSLHLAPLDGGPPRQLGVGAGPVARPYLVGTGSGSGTIAWIAGQGSSERIHRYFDGGSVEALTSSGARGVRAITFDRRNFYWIRGSVTSIQTLQSLTDASATPTSLSLSTTMPGSMTGITSFADGDNLFVTGGPEVREVAKDGTTVQSRATAEEGPGKILSDDVVVAWIDAPGRPGDPLTPLSGVRRKDRFGGGVESAYLGRVNDIALRDSVVYFIEEDGTVFAAPHRSKQVLRLAKGPPSPRAIAVSSEHVYWAASDGVRRVDKPRF